MKAEHAVNNQIQVVAFRLGDEEYGVDIMQVQEIIKVLTITRVPGAHEFIEGVINLRGHIVPVYNLSQRFNKVSSELTDEARIVVLQYEEVKAGIIVDGVTEVLRINLQDIEDAGKVYSSLKAECIEGVGKVEGRLLILLNIARLLGV